MTFIYKYNHIGSLFCHSFLKRGQFVVVTFHTNTVQIKKSKFWGMSRRLIGDAT